MSNLRSHKVVLIGDSGVGKSSLVNSLFNRYKESESSTIGCAYNLYKSKKYKTSLGLWDTAGQERFRSIIKVYFRNAHGVIFVFDLTNPKSYENITEWFDHVDNILKYEKVKPLRYLVGTKDDLVKGEIDMIKYINFAEENNMIFFSTSAKLKRNINELFENISKDLSESKDHIIIEEESKSNLSFFSNDNIYNLDCCGS